ncbi:MAG: sucB, partial [Actinobacteria bacterium]|nr:sucB [Actinomycetota bacterium]
MPTRIIVPEMGESVVSALVARWLKDDGETVAAGEAVVELETEKVNLEVAAEAAGILAIAKPAGAEVRPGDVLGTIAEAAAPLSPAAERSAPAGKTGETRPGAPPAAKAAGPPPLAEPRTPQASANTPAPVPAASAAETPAPRSPTDARGEERVPMSRRRQTIARRLVESLRTAAMLTTFNEVDMGALQELRTRLREATLTRHNLFPGITAFFIKATIDALKAYPRLNAEIQG